MGASKVFVLTGNPGKAEEYRRILGRYGVRPEAVSPNLPGGGRADTDRLAREMVLRGATLVIEESADVYGPGSDVPLSDPRHLSPAVNVSRASAWYPEGDAVGHSAYEEAVRGYVDLRSGTRGGFGWDAIFRNAATGRTYAEDAAAGLKSSARDLVLAKVIRERLHFDRPVDLAFRPLGGDRLVDFGRLPHEHLGRNPLLATPQFAASPVSRLLGHALQRGVFYRSSASRRERNYWLPGLNGGIPLVPKKDDVHETTFQFHDLMHAVMPDLAYDGSVGEALRRVYVLHRMAGEAVSLVAADHAFVDTLERAGVGYDFAKRRIHPLFASMAADVHDPEGFRIMARATARYALTGDDGGFAGLGAAPDALAAFAGKYERFFVEDYRWTVRNFERMAGEAALFSAWHGRLAPALAAAGVETVSAFASRVADRIGGGGEGAIMGMGLHDLADAVFEAAWDRFVGPAVERGPAFGSPAFDPEAARSNAFARWLLGQSVMYARYEHVPGIAAMGRLLEGEMLDRAAGGEPYGPEDVERLRGFHETAVDLLGEARAVSAEEVRLFREVVPVFDPMFVFYESRGPAPTLAEAAEEAFGEAPAAGPRP